MEKKNRIWSYALAVMSLVLILTNSCKEADEEPSTVSDKDGNVYKTITIGTQVWMAENLKTTKYSNGDLIGTTTPPTKDIQNELTPKYQWACGGNESNVDTYGRVYTGYAATDNRNVCPTGWHVPTVTEWNTLITYLGGNNIAGGKLKEAGTTHWQSPNTGATNEAGFAARPGGGHEPSGYFHSIGLYSWCWSSTPDQTNGWIYYMSYDANYLYNISNSKQLGYSVRCLKN